MDIGNTHIDGDVLFAGMLVICGLLAIYMLRNRQKPPIEDINTRALRLVKQQWRKIPLGVLYFVPDDEDKVIRVDSMTAHERTHHSSGRLICNRDGYIEMARIDANQNPWSLRGGHFWTVT